MIFIGPTIKLYLHIIDYLCQFLLKLNNNKKIVQ